MSKKTEMAKAAEAAKIAEETATEEALSSPIPTEVTPTETPKSGETTPRADASAKPAESTPTEAESTPTKPATAEPKATDKPAKAPEMVLISKKEYDAVREVLTVQKGLGENLLKMQELAKSLGDDLTAAKTEIADLRKTAELLKKQLDAEIEKPILVYFCKYADGEEITVEDRRDVFAGDRMPTAFYQAYAWKVGDGLYERLDEDELEERGLENP